MGGRGREARGKATDVGRRPPVQVPRRRRRRGRRRNGRGTIRSGRG